MVKVKSLDDLNSVRGYLNRIGAEARSLRTAVVRENHGAYWKDIAQIHFKANGDVVAPDAFLPSDLEANAIKLEIQVAEWPQPKLVLNLEKLPKMLKEADPENLFIFRNDRNEIVLVQQRMDDREGGKVYIPWTYWDDDEWRRMEPEGKLPLWGAEQLKDHTTVFIHEGAKAARAMQRLTNPKSPADKERLKQHPWGEELSAAAHLGWIGGALSPYRTDWAQLMKAGVKRVYIVSDNDLPGVSAVPAISFNLRVPTFHVQFTQDWPASFDLADPFPKHMFKEVENHVHYVGPSFRSCVHPATWATDQIPNKKGKPTNVLRDEFKAMWAYIEEADLFVCVDMPEILRSEKVLNNMLSAFSHTAMTSHLIVKSYRGRSTKLCYRPDIKGRIVTDKDTSAINLHTPTHAKPNPGSPKPWIDFLEYMFPIPEERKEVERWCATLIARPDVRMEYGLLLVSETQGVGKTTIGEKILSPLVGEHNTGFPTESAVTDSSFNDWLANKRLVVIGEIYSGHSWKAYNKLKSCITDRAIEVNQKFMRPYKVDNWAHIIASSNSRRALKIEQDDRRWFYPKVTENRWPKAKFGELNNWLQSGGLGIIMSWAKNYGDYVSPGERAPMTELKKEMVDGSRSEAQKAVAEFAEAVVMEGLSGTFGIKQMVTWVRSQVQGAVYDTDYELRKAAIEKGFIPYEKRIKTGYAMQYVLMTPKFFNDNRAVIELASDKANEIIRANLKDPGNMIQSVM